MRVILHKPNPNILGPHHPVGSGHIKATLLAQFFWIITIPASAISPSSFISAYRKSHVHAQEQVCSCPCASASSSMLASYIPQVPQHGGHLRFPEHWLLFPRFQNLCMTKSPPCFPDDSTPELHSIWLALRRLTLSQCQFVLHEGLWHQEHWWRVSLDNWVIYQQLIHWVQNPLSPYPGFFSPHF